MRLFAITLLVVMLACAGGYGAFVCLRQFDFDNANALGAWKTMVLNGHVEYTLLKHGDNGYVQALSEKACSALYYRVGFKLKEYPLLSWKWRVLKFPETERAQNEMERDDYAARIYVIFPFLNFSSSKFIEYVWSKDDPAGMVKDSPMGNNIKLIVVRSGAAGREEGEWQQESRNVYDDYVKAFGKEPGLNAGAIAIMCDADSTRTSAESLFDDIVITSESGLDERRVE